VRAIGLDVHLEFCEVAIAEDGEVRSAGRIETKPEQVELFAQSLGAADRVALEVTGNAWEIKRLIEPHVAEVLVVSPNDTGIRQARAKTDRLDGEIEAVGGRARLARPGPWYLFGPARYRAPVEHVRLPDPRLAVDGHLLACTSGLAYAGDYQLTIWTIVPEPAAELHSSYLGHPLDHRTCPHAAASEEWTP
jgi:hypothetical protein